MIMVGRVFSAAGIPSSNTAAKSTATLALTWSVTNMSFSAVWTVDILRIYYNPCDILVEYSCCSAVGSCCYKR